MKVVIAGTFSSGKSTLVADLFQALRPKSLLLADECRPVLDAIPQIDWHVPDVRSYLLVRQVLVEAENRSSELTVIDGGVINVLGHDRALLSPAPDRSVLLRSLGHERYDLVFLCDPADVAVEDDGQRYTDVDLRQEIHQHVLRVLEEEHYEYVILSGTPQNRLEVALRTIGRSIDG